MTLLGALNALEAVTVTGVNNVLDLDELKTAPLHGDLPVRVLTLAGTGGEGFDAYDFAEGGTMVVHVVDYLLIRGMAMGATPATRADLITYFDNYMSAIKTDVFLSDNLRKPLVVMAESFAPFAVAGAMYQGITFRHRWELEI